MPLLVADLVHRRDCGLVAAPEPPYCDAPYATTDAALATWASNLATAFRSVQRILRLRSTDPAHIAERTVSIVSAVVPMPAGSDSQPRGPTQSSKLLGRLAVEAGYAEASSVDKSTVCI